MFRVLQAVLVATLLSACVAKGDPSQPIPTATVPATSGKADRLVIVLPGRADDLGRLQNSGVADSIHQAWPDADVVFAELTLDFYREGDAPKRLRTEVIAPLRARGYREVWMAGASMGGMGTLMYDAQFPGEFDGMLLLAPYLGDFDLLLEIDFAGGVRNGMAARRKASPEQSWQRDVWRYIKQLADDPARSQRIWLAYGDEDRLRKAMPLFVPALDAKQVFVRDGGPHLECMDAGDIGRVARDRRAARADSGRECGQPRQRILGDDFGEARGHAFAVTGRGRRDQVVQRFQQAIEEQHRIAGRLDRQAQFRGRGRALQLQHVDEVHLRGGERAAFRGRCHGGRRRGGHHGCDGCDDRRAVGRCEEALRARGGRSTARVRRPASQSVRRACACRRRGSGSADRAGPRHRISPPRPAHRVPCRSWTVAWHSP